MLKIPAFLDRQTNGIKPAAIKSAGKPRRKKAKPPKAKNWKGAERVNLLLADQCSRIGSGNRYVWAKIGKKWVYLADNYGGRGKLDVRNFNLVKRGN